MTVSLIADGPPNACADRAVGIVLIHALGRSRWSMWLMARRLRAAGWPVALAAYPSLRRTIEASAELVANQIADASRDWSGVNLVGHSLGGIIGRKLALTRPDLRIARVVQIGTPNLGTEVAVRLARRATARRLIGPVLTQVAAFPACEVISAGIASIAGTAHLRWLDAPLGLNGPNDGVVTVRSAWGGAGARATVPISHTFLSYSARAARLVATFLRDGSFNRAQEDQQ
jgi:pimeloyl-ACP methyl ester carboxylesterase